MDPFDPPLDTARHLRYWQRCLRTLLPNHYTSMDSTRLSLAFFIICSIDLLTPSTTTPSSSSSSSSSSPPLADSPAQKPPLLTPTVRAHLRRWVLSCQHPAGGFTGSPTHVFAPHLQAADAGQNANIAGTYFALLLLALLAPEASAEAAFAGVNRAATLRWLRRLQRSDDGSFGEIAYHDDSNVVVAGGKDMRYSYLAAAVRWMLRGPDGDDGLAPTDPDYVEDIDVAALVAHVRRGQTYDGGFAESAAHESHAGYGYCAVAALALLDRPSLLRRGVSEGGDGGGSTSTSSTTRSAVTTERSQMVAAGVPDRAAFVAWLASRQFARAESEDGEEDGDGGQGRSGDENDPETANFRLADLSLAADDASSAAAAPRHIGFNGRCNKVADTCYTWWTLGSLAVLEFPPPEPAALGAQRRFLLEKTQHIIGGFGKHPGSPPDVGHACLGLAALATMGDPGLKRLDAVLCVSRETVGKIERARAGLLKGAKTGEEGEESVPSGQLGQRLIDIAARMGGDRPEWLDAVG